MKIDDGVLKNRGPLMKFRFYTAYKRQEAAHLRESVVQGLATEEVVAS